MIYCHLSGTATVTKHDPPMLFDLDVDPSENYNLTGKLGYEDLLEKLTKMRAAFDSKMVWATSEINKPHHADLMPCCNPGCTPFPRCCHCASQKPSLLSSNHKTVRELWQSLFALALPMLILFMCQPKGRTLFVLLFCFFSFWFLTLFRFAKLVTFKSWLS